MSNTRQIKKADNQALVNIVLDYTRGHSFEEISLRLKEQCTKFNIACKTRYQTIKPEPNSHEYDEGIDRILDSLSIGGASIHLMTTELAKKEGKINCYVWDDNTLTYLQSGKADVVILLRDPALLDRTIQALTNTTLSKTLHLFARQIDELITNNSDDNHIPHTTNPTQIQQFKSCQNLYEVLKKLEIKHPRLTALIDKINEIQPTRTWWLYLMAATGLTATTGLGFYLKENFTLVKAWYEQTLPIVSRWLHNTVYLLSKTPLLGILFLGIPLIQSWSQAIMDDSLTEANKLVRLLFKTVINTLPIVGYLLCYLAAGAMTIPAVALFITGSIVDVLETLYTLLYHEVERYFNPLTPATEYHTASIRACANNTHERNLSIFLVKFTANILAAASVIIWCVFPPSLMIALTCVVFSSLVSLTKSSLIANIKHHYANALQSDLKDICDHYNPPCQTKIELDNLDLRQQNLALTEQNRHLTSENRVIKDIREQDCIKWMSFFSHRSPQNANSGEPDPKLNSEHLLSL